MNPAIAGRFPLMCRPRPLGLPLTERIAAMVASAVDSPGANHHDMVARASGVINIAALIASDVGIRDLAWDMCWCHFNVFAGAEQLAPATAVMALQPLINIPRILIRDGNGQDAYDALSAMYQAAQRKGKADVCGRTVDLSAIIRDEEGHRSVCEELWADMLNDGTRALAQAGRWSQAAESVATHRGVGDRLWDGRQVTILALLDRGRVDEAVAMTEASHIGDSAERAVGALLLTFCALEGSGDATGLAVALGEAQALIELNEPPTVYFRTQAALTALALADTAGEASEPVVRLQEAVTTAARTDTYAARSVLATQKRQNEVLRRTVDSGGLGHGHMPQDLMDQLTGSVVAAEARLKTLLAEPHDAGI